MHSSFIIDMAGTRDTELELTDGEAGLVLTRSVQTNREPPRGVMARAVT